VVEAGVNLRTWEMERLQWSKQQLQEREKSIQGEPAS